MRTKKEERSAPKIVAKTSTQQDRFVEEVVGKMCCALRCAPLIAFFVGGRRTRAVVIETTRVLLPPLLLLQAQALPMLLLLFVLQAQPQPRLLVKRQ